MNSRKFQILSGLHALEHAHAFGDWHGRDAEGLVLKSRRNFLKAGAAGMAGLSLPNLLQARELGGTPSARKSCILLWMAGGPSQIDTWDPKPDRPLQNRGPFGVIPTRLPGVNICEHLPAMAGMLDKFTLIRSVDCRHSNHEPNKVMQTANKLAEARINPEAERYPAIGSIVAKHHGANDPSMPPYVAFMKSRSHIAFSGYLGSQYDPFIAQSAAKLPIYNNVGVDSGKIGGGEVFDLPKGLDQGRMSGRTRLRSQIEDVRRGVDPLLDQVSGLDPYTKKAMDMLTGQAARNAFDISREPSANRERYGKHLWQQQVLLARRLVEAGVAFVTLDLSYHSASGTWDNHGDNIPPYGGISKGLKPLLPLFDHMITTLVADLEERGLLDECLIIAMGEFGRTPVMGTQGSTDGRNHWPNVMSMAMAGGGLRHGQVIGSTESEGGYIKDRPVTPADLAATIYKHFGVPLNTTY
ncbi:MAG: DUF1501 domain-containing protein, partial [Planctomycetota bacterium]